MNVKTIEKIANFLQSGTAHAGALILSFGVFGYTCYSAADIIKGRDTVYTAEYVGLPIEVIREDLLFKPDDCYIRLRELSRPESCGRGFVITDEGRLVTDAGTSIVLGEEDCYKIE